MHTLAFLLILAALVPAMPSAAQSLPNEVVGHKIRVPGDKVEGTTEKLSEVERLIVEALPPQQQAERLLQYAISHHVGATDEIKARVKEWRGTIATSQTMATLLDVARNGANLRVRAAAIEIELAAMNMAKTAAQVDALLARIAGSPKDARSEIYTLGLLGNRGIETDRIHTSRGPTTTWCVTRPTPRSRTWAPTIRSPISSRRSITTRRQPCRSTAAAVAWRTAGC